MSFLNHIPFGLIGLGLAVIDFTGASKKLEAWIVQFAQWERAFGNEARANIGTLDPAYHRDAFPDFLFGYGLASICLVGIALIYGTVGWLEIPIAWVSDWPTWSFVVLAPVAVIGLYIFDHFAKEILGYLVCLVIWAPLWVLSRPKAGFVGTLGLIIAAADNWLG